jgi:hypothetical protein
MKNRILQSLVLLFFVLGAHAQQGINYKAIIKDGEGAAIANTAVTVQFTILESGTTEVYQETHNPTTDANGIVIVNIGEGTVVSGVFNDIDWGSNPHYLKTEINTGSGLTDMGTTEFKTVPYALHAKTSEQISNGLAIGDTYGGGIIFYLDASGKHGLVAATTDQSPSVIWWNGVYMQTKAFASSVGGGDGNTSMIVFSQGFAGTYAAKLCWELSLDGFTDWYLPSKYELDLMYWNIGPGNLLGLGNVGGFVGDYYWSSSEFNSGEVWAHIFDNNYQVSILQDKRFSFRVRAVRAF